jgi:hypothetical protein
MLNVNKNRMSRNLKKCAASWDNPAIQYVMHDTTSVGMIRSGTRSKSSRDISHALAL